MVIKSLFMYNFPMNISGMKTLLRALHSRNFKLFLAGQSVSLIGTWMQSVAMSWLVYRLTGSAFLLGVIGFTSQIPTFLFPLSQVCLPTDGIESGF